MKFISKNSSTLELIKWLSIISMLIDHMGLLIFDDNLYMRTIGRFALIGFSFLLAYNYRYNTKNKWAYKIRLLKWGLIAQVPYSLAFGIDAGINIMFLLLMGLISIDIFQTIPKDDKVIMPSLYFTVIIMLSYFTGYFLFGVLVIVFFYFALENKKNIIFLLLSVSALNFNVVYASFALVYVYIIYRVDTPLNIPRVQGLLPLLPYSLAHTSTYKYFFLETKIIICTNM